MTQLEDHQTVSEVSLAPHTEKKQPQHSRFQDLSPEAQQQLVQMQARMREGVGTITMAMMNVPRYRNCSLADLQGLIIDPLLSNRISLAQGAENDEPQLQDIRGIAIWASVSEDVDLKIKEQIRAGVFPLKLKPQDWTSGSINWLIDVIAPDPKAIASMLVHFRQLVKEGELHLHPQISKLVDKELLEKLGAKKMKTQS
ncbi:toxin-activating lysine-acyltransferase (plasmid) [Microbulbifer sp. MKSA007]|nr:toxin-activating lysine-acyltransferase [Microbulbifer sp. MKSA007]